VARKRRSSLLAVALALSLAACATAPPREPIAKDARAALARLAARWDTLRDLRALAEVTVRRNGETQRLAGVLLLQAPASLRFEALSPFGQPLLLATVHEGRLTAYNAARNEGTVGPATAETIGRALGLPLEPDDLVATLAGRTAPPRDLRTAEVLPADAHGPSLEIHDGARRRRIWLAPETGVVHRLELVGARFAVLVAYRWEGGHLAGFVLDAADGQVTASITYRNLAENRGVDPARFALTLPKGAKIQTIR
jgi:outer membrane lipoprotein-sorting protein